MKTCTHTDDEACEACCEHGDTLDHGVCIDCGKDCTEELAAAAECAYKGDR